MSVFESHQAMLFEPSYEDAGFERLWLAERRIDVVEWTRVGDGWDQRWKAKRPYINIIDIVLPKRDGIQCIRRLKAFDRNCKVIVLTAFEGKWGAHWIAKAMEAGADGFVPKPLKKERFLASVDYVLGLSGRKK